MGRREEDERPPIEIFGADPGVSSSQHVAMGPRGPRRTRARLLAVVALVVAVLLGGLALGGSDDDEPERAADDEPRDNQDHIELGKRTITTTARGSTTTRPTTTTTTAPLGPVFGEPVEGALLLYSGSSWRVLDLTTGAMHDVHLPTLDPYASVPFDGGIVIPTGRATFYPILGAGEDPAPRDLGPADTVLRAGRDRLWLIDLPPESDDLTPRVDARLVDADGTVHRSVQAPGRWVDRATAEVVLISRGGRVYAAGEDGVRAIAVGSTTGTNAGAAIVLTCDEEAVCALRRQPVDGSPGRVLRELGDPDSSYYDAFEAPDGRLGLVSYPQLGGSPSILLFGPDGSSLGQVELSASSFTSVPQWLPNNLGLVVSSGRGLEWVRPVGGGWEVLPVEGLDRSQEAVFVITP